MYEEYFSFKQAPFSIAPDPSFLYPSPQHKKGLEQLVYGLKKEGGFIVLTGEVGTGKTTLCRLFLSQINDNIVAATLFNSKLDSTELLKHIANTLAIDNIESKSSYQVSDAIEAKLLEHHQAGKKTLLIIEESQNLSPDTLETLRLLTNFETDTEKLIHILLIGQPELVTTLNRPDLRQLNQRVIARFHFRPLTQEETEHYIVHRLSVVGGQQQVFKKAAIKALYSYSQGVPRLINLLADRALQITYEDNQKFVSATAIELANEHINGVKPATNSNNKIARIDSSKLYLWIAIVAIIIGIISISAILLNIQIDQKQTITLIDQNTAEHSPSVHKASNIAVPIVQEPQLEQAKVAASFASPTRQLLTLWQIPTHVTEKLELSRDNLCILSASYDLNCLDMQATTFEYLTQINRPAIITLFNAQGLAEQQLLESINDNLVTTYGSEGQQQLNLDELALRWRGDALILWRTAPGFIETIRLNDKSIQTVTWLQNALQELGYIDGRMLTGGSYTQVLADKVKQFQGDHGLSPDGSLGVNTIIAINSALNKSPMLISADRAPKSR